MVWKVEFSETALKQFAKLGEVQSARIGRYMNRHVAMLDDPRSAGKALAGPLAGLWRYRDGDWRVLCEIRDGTLRIVVVKIGNRRDVYR